jgi:hypothetical protein
MIPHKQYTISNGQYLSDIWETIPSNIIFNKTLPGIGATTLEITSKRNSIIIEPNVPVIQGKMGKYNTKSKMLIRGVYEGVTEDQIIDYLESSVKYKKIIVTPESFERVKDSINSVGYDLYGDFFLLFDECERAIQDVGYRGKVILPMQDFFKFKSKAFISATLILPSDPRFARHKFNYVSLTPDFDHKKDLNLIVTDYTLLSLKRFIDDNPREKYFIFIKSTEHIARIIKAFNIIKESAIFCAKDSKQKLRANGFSHVSTTLTEFEKYNFFTSRFNSAVDIEYSGEPTVIVVSDIITVEHSMLDPLSEVVQISGRFRKPLKDLVHITNLNPLLKSKTEDDVKREINDSHKVYKVVRRFYEGSTSLSGKETLRQMLEWVDYAKYIDWKGERNHYMVDNTIYEEKTKSFYKREEHLIAAYRSSNQFNLSISKEQNAFTEVNQLRALRSPRLKSVYEIIIPVLKDLYEPGKHTMYEIFFTEMHLQMEYPKVLADFKRLGYDEVAKLNFDPKLIKKSITKLNNKDQYDHFGLINFIANNFKKHQCYPTDQIEAILQKGLQELNLSGLKPGITLLKKFCMVERCTYQTKTKARKEIKGYVITQLPR